VSPLNPYYPALPTWAQVLEPSLPDDDVHSGSTQPYALVLPPYRLSAEVDTVQQIGSHNWKASCPSSPMLNRTQFFSHPLIPNTSPEYCLTPTVRPLPMSLSTLFPVAKISDSNQILWPTQILFAGAFWIFQILTLRRSSMMRQWKLTMIWCEGQLVFGNITQWECNMCVFVDKHQMNVVVVIMGRLL
jgi:hypothetical protein